ncbi:MAG: PAS domain S-box protein [Haloquadratum sp.]
MGEWSTAEESPGEIRVLHVDDDARFLDRTASFLIEFDDAFSVYTSTDADRALERVETGVFDCVVSDYDLSGMTGLDLLDRVREREPDVPFILYTGKGSEEVASEAISAGVTDYFQKEEGTDQYPVLANRIENAVEQYRSRQALAESQERLSRFVQQSPLGTIEFDESFRIVRVNESAEEITGYDAEELVDGTWLPLVPEDERRHVAEVERQLLADRGGYRSTNEIVTKDGERRLTSWHNRVVTDESGSVISIFSQFDDVTEARERRQELERTNAVLATLFETLPVGVLAENADREVIRVNERLFDLLDIPGTPQEAVGSDCRELARAVADRFEDADGFVARIEDLTDAREPAWNDELKLTGGRTLERNYRPIELPDGQGHLWVYYDVTDRERRERRLEALTETARELMAAESHEAVAEIGVDAAERVLGLDASAIHLYEEGTGLVPAAATETVRDLLDGIPTFTEGEGIAWRSFETGESFAVDDVREESDVYNPDTPIRSEIHLPLGAYGHFIAGSPEPGAFDQEDVALGEILAVTIVTALEQVDRNERLREREEELTRQNARLEQFASVVSHDLRNPLQVASGRLDLAADDCDSEHLEAVSRAHDRMESLIEDLLTLARGEQSTIDPSPVELRSFAERCWETVDTTDATLAVETDRVIRADETQLRQLLENLFRNAVEHAGPAVTVTVGALDDPDDGTAIGFYVADDGSGIAPEAREEIFEYGYSTDADGTGFGLSIARRCAENHGWEISATESAAGGARFEITDVDVVER